MRAGRNIVLREQEFRRCELRTEVRRRRMMSKDRNDFMVGYLLVFEVPGEKIVSS